MRLSVRSGTSALVVAVVAGTLVVHGWHAMTTACYVNAVTGVWFALAKDLTEGIFYRGLVGPDGYGATRYFPLFFTALAGLMRAGLSPLAAGFAVSLGAAALLVLGVRRFLTRLGLPEVLALSCAAFALAPPFVQQTVFAIRSDVLATAFVVWGLAFSLPAFEDGRPRNGTLLLAAAFFTLAAATKVTSIYAAAAVVCSLALSSRWRAALRLAWLVAAGLLLLVGGIEILSRGRAIETFRACALGGATVAGWLSGIWPVVWSQIISPSRLFVGVLLTAGVAWLVGVRAAWTSLPALFFPFALGSTAIVLASPGTIFTNQLIDAHVASVVVIGWILALRPRLRTAGALLLLVLALASVRQNVSGVARPDLRRAARALPSQRMELIEQVGGFRRPVLSEAPEIPVLAGTRPLLVDPFALRVAMLKRSDVGADLLARLDARAFAYVVLMQDPLTPSGRGWYENVDLGAPVADRILANYEYATTRAGLRIYVPRRPPTF